MSTGEGDTPLEASKIIRDEHVRQVVRADKGPEARLSSWTTEDFTQKGDNYVTVVTSVKVTFTLHGKQQTDSYVVKINPKSGVLRESPALSCILFQKEAGFYSDLSPALETELKRFSVRPLNVPKCFFTDLESRYELLFLEDLRPRGFRMYDRKKQLDQAHTILFLQELARLHAASLLLQAKTPHTDLAERFNYLKLDLTNVPGSGGESFHNLFKGPCKVAAVILSECEGYKNAAKWAKDAAENSPAVFDNQMKREAPFEVLCHGDCWKNNVVFRYNDAGEPVEMMLLDLQCCRVASPATDLAYLLYTSLDAVVRKTHLDDFLATYYNTFTSVLEAGGMTAPFTLSELRQEYTRKEEFGILFATMVVTSQLEGETFIDDYGSTRDDYYNKVIETFTKNPIEWMNNTQLFHSHFLPLYETMKDE